MDQNDGKSKKGMRMWLTILAVFAIGAAVGILFQGELGITAGGGLLILLLLACPLMMWLMMRGDHGDSNKDKRR